MTHVFRPDPSAGDRDCVCSEDRYAPIHRDTTVRCVVDCGCAGGQPAESCRFVPSCSRCRYHEPKASCGPFLTRCGLRHPAGSLPVGWNTATELSAIYRGSRNS